MTKGRESLQIVTVGNGSMNSPPCSELGKNNIEDSVHGRNLEFLVNSVHTLV